MLEILIFWGRTLRNYWACIFVTYSRHFDAEEVVLVLYLYQCFVAALLLIMSLRPLFFCADHDVELKLKSKKIRRAR